MKKKRGTFVVSLLIFYVLFSGQVFATKLKILTEHLAPYQIVNEDSITGLSTEIVTATLQESQYTYDIVAYPWAMSYSRAKQEKNTCIYSLARIPQREPLFKWVGHIISSTVSLYSMKNRKIHISNIEEAKKYNIAVIRDDVTHHFFLGKGFVENENLYVANKYDALLKLLDMPSRNIDLVVINNDLLRNRVKNLAQIVKYKKVLHLDELSLNFHLACSLTTEQQIVDNLIKAMNMLENRGVFSKIREKWKNNMAGLTNE